MIRKTNQCLFFVCCLTVLTGCALFVPSYPYSENYLQPQSLTQIESPFRLHHQLTVDFGPRQITFRTIFEIDSEQATFVLLTPMGSRALSVTQRGHNLTVQNLTDREFPIDPRRLYVDLQTMIWPEIDLDAPYSLRVETTSAQDGPDVKIRRVFRAGEPFLRIRMPADSPFEGERTLEGSDTGYSLKLETQFVEHNL